MKNFIVFLVGIIGFSNLYGTSMPLRFDQLGKPENYRITQQINKVVIWGHKLHSHTHSYIHYAFDKAFRHLDYDTYWFDNADNVRNFDFAGSLFITEGQVDVNMPVRSDCFYILHNCDLKKAKYADLTKYNNYIVLQVYTHDVLPRPVKAVGDLVFYDVKDKCMYMPWATDLLPEEIEENKRKISSVHKSNTVYFVGSVGGGIFGNIDQINPFKKACQENGLFFKTSGGGGVSEEENIRLIKHSYIAPALQGEWQCEKGYIPCRIFKNISYGQMGVTNSKTVADLFAGKIVYNADTYQLFYDAQKRLKTLKIEELYELMDLVKTKHTYLNRIDHLLKFMDIVIEGQTF